MDGASPAARTLALALACRDVLERELLATRGLAGRSAARLSAALEEALVRLSRFVEADSAELDYLTELDAARDAVTGARASLPSRGGLAARHGAALDDVDASLAHARSAALDAVVARQNELLHARAGRVESGARPLRASVGVPALHVLDRDPVRPFVDRANCDLADESDEVDGAPEAPVEETTTPSPLARLARDCVEDIGALGGLRRPRGELAWTATARFEQRLLDNLDALASLAGRDADGADVLGILIERSREVSFPDPGRAFALAFVLGCTTGDDGVRAALFAWRQAHPRTRAAFADALALASNGAIDLGARDLLRSGDPELARLALDVLRRRDAGSFAHIAPLLGHPDADVRAAAALGLGHLPEPAPATALLERAAMTEDDDAVALAIAEGLLIQGELRGLALARRVLASSGGASARRDAATLVALAGGPGDVDPLVALAAADGAAIPALGWLGHTRAVERLLERLEREGARAEGATRARAIADALERITGAGLTRHEDDGAPPAAAYRAFWAAHRARFDPARRHRFGEPHTLATSLDELEREGSTATARRTCAREVAIAEGPEAHVDTDGWIARQRVALAALRARLAERDREAPGAFPEARVAKRGSARGVPPIR
jgi:hypothetical protein